MALGAGPQPLAGLTPSAPRWRRREPPGYRAAPRGLKWRDTLYLEAARTRYRGRMGAARTFGIARKVPFLQGTDEK